MSGKGLKIDQILKEKGNTKYVCTDKHWGERLERYKTDISILQVPGFCNDVYEVT